MFYDRSAYWLQVLEAFRWNSAIRCTRTAASDRALHAHVTKSGQPGVAVSDVKKRYLVGARMKVRAISGFVWWEIVPTHLHTCYDHDD